MPFPKHILCLILSLDLSFSDRINVSDVNRDTDYTGAPGWVVKDVDLFTTTVIYG